MNNIGGLLRATFLIYRRYAPKGTTSATKSTNQMISKIDSKGIYRISATLTDSVVLANESS